MTKSVVLFGFWGFGNLGDEAILSVVIEDIKAAWPGARLTLISERPELTRAMYQVEAIGWRQSAPLVEAIKAADHVVIGGGGLWNSYFPFLPAETDDPLRDHANFAARIFSTPLAALLLGVPCTIYCVGAGVVQGEGPFRLAALGAACAGSVIVRDQTSKAFMARLLEDLGRVDVAADPAFSVSKPTDAELESLTDEIAFAGERAPIVGIARDWFGYSRSELANAFAATLSAAARLAGRPVVLLPMDVALHGYENLNDDVGLSEAIAARMPGVKTRIVRGEHHPRAAAHLIAQAAAVISMRLHGCILSIRGEVPVLGVNYDPKVAAVLNDLGLGDQIVSMDAIGLPETAERLARMATGSGRVAVVKAREIASASSARGPAFLAEALDAGRLPCLPPQARALQARYAAGFIQARAAAERSLPVLAASLREASGSSRSDYAQPLAATLSALFPENGEWPYLDAIARASCHAPPSEVLALLECALSSGFPREWVLHVTITELLRMGDPGGAEKRLRELIAGFPDHPDLSELRRLVDAALGA